MIQNPIKPQRLSRPVLPGALLKRPLEIARRMQLRQFAERDPVYLARVRQCPCLRCGADSAGEAAHLRMASGAHGKASAIGKKPADRWALPLCAEHHRLTRRAQHTVGERAFWSEIGVNPLLIAERLFAQREDLVAMRAVVIQAIAERGR